MKYYIGIDGGGTKSKCVLCSENLNKVYETQSGPTNFLTIGTETVAETLIRLISECCDNQKISIDNIQAIVLGTTGAGRESDAQKLEIAVDKLSKSKGISQLKFRVVSDARIALEAAFSGNPGSILISGTGSIMFGKDMNGNIHRVGGFGRLIGDEGSGLTIGKKGLNLLSKYYDGRGNHSILQEKVENRLGIKDQNSLITKVYSENLQIQEIAPYVLESANEGDELCKNILDEETNELLLHIAAMTKKINIDNMKLVFVGGLISNENIFSNMLKQKIKLFLPNIILQDPDNPPEIGAVIMAKQLSGKNEQPSEK
jgi:N-acetylglucosamine kinase-like BadF-type ATPase